MQRRLFGCLLKRKFSFRPAEFSTQEDPLDLFQSRGAPKYEKAIEFNSISNAPKKKSWEARIPKVSKKSNRKTSLQEDKGHAVIKCLRPEFNHYKNQKYEPDQIKLASKGWDHYKSKGDHFTIQLYENDFDSSSYFYGESASFEGLTLEQKVIDALQRIDIERPTIIQEKSIPVVLAGKNALIAAETGCGKTLAYLAPVVQQLIRWNQTSLKERPPNSPLAVILCPSRELASQIGYLAKKLSLLLPFNCTTLLGGSTKKKMMNPNFYDVDLLISTPGVISKMSTIALYDLSYAKHVVVDESDTMLDDSFNEILLRLLKRMKISYFNDPKAEEPTGCQLTLVSATVPTSIYSILEDIVEPDSLERIESPRLHRVMPHVPQTFYRLGLVQKPGKLLQLVKNAALEKKPTLIFSNKTKTCDWISLMLHENGVPTLSLNGDMPSLIRAGIFSQFKNGEVNVLSCTDIASRGLDTNNVKLLINYDFPNFMADYVHRCGRAGRISSPKDCSIVNFVTYPREIQLVHTIEMAVRTMKDLPNVNANIRRLITYRK
ncbi:ATP-dependent RNA helicase [Nesidiocoris tenuis]|uniref:ATP-dependent RNA helicase n=1 Tax=Nesidiocoris tenuis TaxID=355587 RepID=A0ABN7A542_9HEMI|nr:ATP-dependent RNA helicase [Nesidiocoris tenuis]